MLSTEDMNRDVKLSSKELKGFFYNSGPLWDKADMIESYIEQVISTVGIPFIDDGTVHSDDMFDFLREYSTKFFDKVMLGVCNVITSFEKTADMEMPENDEETNN